ncbi:amidohydrolase family protein [Streptomyces sp. SID161]|uniref:amidohydrolase family protein n=1 Tax=Streptomyces sp. SID161 TaxID=2690251 RepID=UPI00136815B6|nr:amidohydrolase family protein [Streptomyces sp. SID161]MYW44170.1 amidohydrolase family protein [Streptomyces sp. SID161]
MTHEHEHEHEHEDEPAAPPLDAAIDVHAHFITPRLRAAMTHAGHDRPDGVAAIPDWSPRAALAVMDGAGIAAALLSVSSPGVHLTGAAATRELARSVNEEAADIIRDHPRRLGQLATLPLPDIPAALDELRYAYDELGADGIILLTHYAGRHLGDPCYEPLMAELDRRAAVVFLHPTSPPCADATSLGRPRPMLEFPFETTRAVSNLILNGVCDRYPAVRFIVPHAGGALPALADRVAAFAAAYGDTPVDVIGALGRFYFDTAGFPLPRLLPALSTLVPDDHLLYGSDYPFTPDWVVHGLAATLAGTGELSTEQHRSLQRTAAAALFPRLAHTP